MNPNPVDWFEIHVQDMNRAKAFYETVFQVTLQQLPAPSTPADDPCEGSLDMWSFPMS